MMGLGERLKQARKMARLSQEALAKEADVTKQSISKYEHDQSVPSSGVLRKLARALNVKVEFFLRPKRAVEVQVPAYRRHSRLRKKEQNAVVARLQEWLERYLEAESFLPPEEVCRFKVPRVNREVGSLDEVEGVAERLRRAWRLGLDPIENLMEMLEDKGIKVGLVKADERFDALTLWLDDVVPVIAVNQSFFPGDRQRFSLAHELGHLILRPGKGVDEERAANRFAGAFLVPAAMARYELGQQRDTLDLYELHLLKHKFGLSMLGWVCRAKDLDVLSEPAAQRLYRLFSSRGWRQHEPGKGVPQEEPTRMERLLMKVLARDLISESRAAELLGKPLRQFREEVIRTYDGLPVGIGD